MFSSSSEVDVHIPHDPGISSGEIVDQRVISKREPMRLPLDLHGAPSICNSSFPTYPTSFQMTEGFSTTEADPR